MNPWFVEGNEAASSLEFPNLVPLSFIAVMDGDLVSNSENVAHLVTKLEGDGLTILQLVPPDLHITGQGARDDIQVTVQVQVEIGECMLFQYALQTKCRLF